MGVRSRGLYLARELAAIPGCQIMALCDVDSRYLASAADVVEQACGARPRFEKDVRRLLEDRDLDALVVAAPDHWHAPAAILAASAGKHVFLEKPCSHNPREGELLIEAERRFGRVLHMGNQRRSWPNVIRCIERLREGVIGRVYFAKGWYTNARAPLAPGKEAPVPESLDWDLWQGPAPRRPYRDNVHPYDWHWFRHWGTGEALNNGTHEIDVMRWGLGVDYPRRVVAAGGRYHHQDEWEFPDTQVLAFDFEGGSTITWESRSRNSHPVEGWDRGVIFHGERGTVLQVHDGWVAWANDKERTVLERGGSVERGSVDVTNTVSPDAALDGLHLQSFLAAVRGERPTPSPMTEAHKSVLLCQLGNIAWFTGRALDVDPRDGRILHDAEAMSWWSREYEPGWEPAV
jgi:predicted dehydrogenase